MRTGEWRNGTQLDFRFVILRNQAENARLRCGTPVVAGRAGPGYIDCDDPYVVLKRRFLNDAVVSLGALTLLIVTLIAIDDRVREQITMRFHAGPSAQIADIGSRLQDVAAIVAVAARDQSIEHAPLVIFALAATVLVLFMLRT